MADFDADGRQDLITGCFEGGAYLLRGVEGRRFAPPIAILDRDGDVLRCGQYWDSDAKAWTEAKKSNTPDLLGIAATPVDWDADGDLDLLLGTNEGRILLRKNLGSAKRFEFDGQNTLLEVAGRPWDVPQGHAMPVVADWDGDGRFDVLSGNDEGAAFWWRNVGRAGAPEFQPALTLLESAERRNVRTRGPGERIQLHVCDYDGDGGLDLLVGDYWSIGDPGSDGESKFHGFVWLLRREAGEK